MMTIGGVALSAWIAALGLPYEPAVTFETSGHRIKCARESGGCVAEWAAGHFIIAFADRQMMEPEIVRVVAHELCHVKLDRSVMNDWASLPKDEREKRHARVEKCADGLLWKLRLQKYARR